jgi:hypothetical protein
MRELSASFMNNLLSPDGMLYPIIIKVKKDQTLMLAIRDNFINIYYRGGSILELREKKNGFYQTFFDPLYNKSGQEIPKLPPSITNQDDAEKWVVSLPNLKNIMDESRSIYDKSEREFQQLVARENNYSTISNESEYFISDIEVSESGARFDMVAIRWLAKDRRRGNICRPAFIEMKYGDNAITGKSGLLKHLQDMDTLIANKEKYNNLIRAIEKQFNQLDQLGLVKFNKGQKFDKISFTDEKPEVIFILANHNPRGTGLLEILNAPEISAFSESQNFDLRFFVAHFAGYSLQSKYMLTLPKFLEHLL